MKEYIVKVYPDRTMWYNLKGQLHRENGPAFEWKNGDKSWYINDKRHREDGPAVECADGRKHWWLNNLLLTEEQFNNRMSKDPCDGKTVEIDGKKYKLILQ